jgi:CHASE2 domain-containing sensor protein
MTGSGSEVWQRFRKGLNGWPTRIVPGVAIILAVIAVRGMGWLQALEWQALDTFLRVRPPEATDERIVIIGIDETDLQHIGTYPIPDSKLAELLLTIQQYNPRVIGLDLYRDLPIHPGHEVFKQVIQELEHLIAIELLLPPSVRGPAYLPEDRIGFVDVIADGDGFLRRSLLGATDPAGEYHFAFSLRLAERYLNQEGFPLENGIRDPVAMRFGTTELASLPPNAGGYVRADMGGHQVLVNFRSGTTSFRRVSWRQLQAGDVEPEWLRDRIVLIGMTAPSTKDFVNSAALSSANPGLVYGVEFQAHAISQIVNAVLENRPLLRVWPEGWEYLWIALWGGLGIVFGRIVRKPIQQVTLVTGGSLVLIAVGYGALLWFGWWIPVVPTLGVFVTNGVVFPLFYWYDQGLRSRIQERQLVIDSAFNAIHNGPLQSLARILHEAYAQPQGPNALYDSLQDLNRELRDVYVLMRQETLTEGSQFYLNHQQAVDLTIPLHQMLCEVYTRTLQQDFPGFHSLKVKVIDFAPMNDRLLTLEDKRNLCRFFQEALHNVGKHAHRATRLTITCKQTEGQNLIRIADNGQGHAITNSDQPLPPIGGHGTQHAQLLSRRLRGRFRRYGNSPKGMVCELVWPTKRWLLK